MKNKYFVKHKMWIKQSFIHYFNKVLVESVFKLISSYALEY